MNMVRPLALAALSVVLLASAPVVAQPSCGTMDAGPGRMQARNAQRQSMMDQTHNAKTSAERRKLIAEHMKVMQEQMAAMHGMMGPGGMMGQNQGSAPADPNATSQIQTMRQHELDAADDGADAAGATANDETRPIAKRRPIGLAFVALITAVADMSGAAYVAPQVLSLELRPNRRDSEVGASYR